MSRDEVFQGLCSAVRGIAREADQLFMTNFSRGQQAVVYGGSSALLDEVSRAVILIQALDGTEEDTTGAWERKFPKAALAWKNRTPFPVLEIPCIGS